MPTYLLMVERISNRGKVLQRESLAFSSVRTMAEFIERLTHGEKEVNRICFDVALPGIGCDSLKHPVTQI